MLTDLERAVAALAAKQAPITTLWRYFDGDHPVVYTNERLREVFSGVDARFTENWCSVVVNAVADRVALQGWTVAGDEAATQQLADDWATLDMSIEAADAHLAAMVTGEAFLIIWPDEDDQVQAYYNDPRLCHVQYDPANPRKALWAAKWWDGDDEKRYLTLYYPDRLEYYVSRNKATDVLSARAFRELQPPAPHDHNQIPVFHFRTDRRRRRSDLDDAIPIQNGINKLLIDMMVAAEFGAFKQRYVIANFDNEELKNAPNEVWTLPSGDGIGQGTSVGEFSATDLDNYLQAIEQLAHSIGAITRTPKHYFFGQGGDPSGEALIALEAPLNKKAGDRIERFIPTWRRAAAFMLQLRGYTTPVRSISPQFARPETVQPLTQAQVFTQEGAGGLPLRTRLRRQGMNEAQIAQVEQDRVDEERAGADTIRARQLLAQADTVPAEAQ